jgi:CRISPR-associated endonuclease/helicase Cas3
LDTFFAHSGEQADRSDWQLLCEHLIAVGRLAKQNAQEAVGPNHPLVEAAELAGLLHDLGKYRDGFQRHLSGDAVAMQERRHKEFGSVRAAAQRSAEIAFAIHGHHGGLADKARCQDAWNDPLIRVELPALMGLAEAEIPGLEGRVCPAIAPQKHGDTDFQTRMLFSCLVDADWSDTAEHERQVHHRQRELPESPFAAADWLDKLRDYVAERSKQCRDSRMREIRSEILTHALQGAEKPPGHFTLTVPTGGGKTLASLAFALRHADYHRATRGDRCFRRIIYVAPFLSIIDQNVDVIRDALQLGDTPNALFEHHSLARNRVDRDKRVLDSSGEFADSVGASATLRSSERWSAPLIVTTNVQFFESLFANQPRACRKLHNIARSIIVLDECHLIPPGLLAPTLAMLQRLVEKFGCSVVFATATPLSLRDLKLPLPLTPIHELMPDGLQLLTRLKRVSVSWPLETDAPLSWDAVGRKVGAESAGLVVVNTRHAARELFENIVRNGHGAPLHLSTSMCPAHRRSVIVEVKRRLAEKLPCHLVSTQLIEAGVDLDFPFVMREMAPLMSVIQAAGRCNREGLLGPGGGRVEVFRSEAGKLPMDTWYRRGIEWVWATFQRRGRMPDLERLSDLQEYLANLYHPDRLDEMNICELQDKLRFQTVSESYRLIEDEGVAVVVRHFNPEVIDPLLAQVALEPSAANRRALVPYQVNFRQFEMTQREAEIHEAVPGIFVWLGPYDPFIGVVEPAEAPLLLV